MKKKIDDVPTAEDVKGVDLKMPFGKHAGKYVHDVPLDYLYWLFDQKGMAKKLGARLYDRIEELLEDYDPVVSELEREYVDEDCDATDLDIY